MPPTRTEIHAFVERHSVLIYAAAANAARRHALDPHDVAHDAITALLHLHAKGTFDPASLREDERYLRAVVRNTALRASRHGRRHVPSSDRLEPLLEAHSPEPPAMHDRLDARTCLTTLTERLRPRDALAFDLLIDEEQGVAEIAHALETNANNVYQMRHRVRTAARALGRELMEAS